VGLLVPELAQAALLFAAAFAAGAINAVAGGGSLVSFPTLLAVGLPSIQANVTNTVALWPGYLGGSLNYRHELRPRKDRLKALASPCVLGALVGAWVLLATPQPVFDVIVPFLILGACGLMAAQDRLNAFVMRHHPASMGGDGHTPWPLWLATFLLGVYGAYFGAALGIMLLAVLGVLLPDDIQRSNALKGMLSLVINAVAVVYFAFLGPVVWWAAAVMAVGAVFGGYGGAGLARRLGRTWLRRVVISYGVFVALFLLGRLATSG
jgi:uncharacterized membrane protein YfcA